MMKRRQWNVPEVVQTSALDCGPASLAALARGFGIDASYPALRELCQTDVDGTSIDVLEDVAQQLGLDATQQLIPVDFLLDGPQEGGPAIAVTRLPTGFVHFVVIWRRLAGWYQVMDPARGRIWMSADELAGRLYQHSMPVPAKHWLSWAQSPEYRQNLGHRAEQLGLRIPKASLESTRWAEIAALDGSLRMLRRLSRSAKIPKNDLGRIFEKTLQQPELIPDEFKIVRQRPGRGNQLIARGALVVRIGKGEPKKPLKMAEKIVDQNRRHSLLELLVDSWKAPTMIAVATVTGAAVTVAEALIARFLVMPVHLAQDQLLLLGVMTGLSIFLLAAILLQFRSTDAQLGLGRRFETQLRVRLLERLPRMKGSFFSSRLSGDLTERAHNVHRARQLPSAAESILRAFAELIFIGLGLLWLFPSGWPLVLLLAVAAIAIPMSFQRSLLDQDLKVRTHNGSLSRFFLATLTGLETARAHSGESVLRQEHESLLTDWGRGSYRYLRLGFAAESVQTLITGGLAIGLIATYASHSLAKGGLLLVSYWALKLPVLGYSLGRLLLRWPTLRNAVTRIGEPLEAPVRPTFPAPPISGSESRGYAIQLRSVEVSTGGRVRLAIDRLDLTPGERVAIVGSSGAGKSTLIRLLLGLSEPSKGSVLVDGQPLCDELLARVRRGTVWLDPAVRLANGSFLDNLQFGNEAGGLEDIDGYIQASELGTLIGERGGLSASVGEAGCGLSGGEGQRLRLARGLVRPAKLVLMDEAFRGLGRSQRARVFQRCLARWQHATLINVTHDLFAAHQHFDRVLVLRRGRIVQDGNPQELLRDTAGTYAQLYRFEQDRATALWGDDRWVRYGLSSRDEGVGSDSIPNPQRSLV